MLIKIMKTFLGIMLVPFCIGFTIELASMLTSVSYRQNAPYYFLLGGLTYLTVHLLFRKPILTYVFGHELTHALFAVLFGGTVKSFHASDRGGRVTITKSNFVITLAPYFFPLYTFFALILYWVCVTVPIRGAEGWLVFFTGTTYSFHLILTMAFLRTDQDDIRDEGAFFSYPLIYLFNILFLALLVSVLMTTNMNFFRFVLEGTVKTVAVASAFGKNVYAMILAVSG